MRERLTAKTARLGRASEEQADFTEMQISASASFACTAEPRLPAILKFRMCGTASAGLLMLTFFSLESAARR